MASQDSIDIEISEPIKSCHRRPEFFYHKRFVTIRSLNTSLQSKAVTTIYHGTHLIEKDAICGGTIGQPSTYTFKGKEKKWRILGGEKFYSPLCCSYLAEPNEYPKAMTPDNCLDEVFGPFAWFGTEKADTDRAGGTLVYRQEVTHVVIICCEEDQQYHSYPIIQINSSKYFEPPWMSASEMTECPEVSSLATTSTSKYVLLNERCEYTAFALYLPGDTKLQLSSAAGKISKNTHTGYCVKSKGECCMQFD
ncbi:uncharacterized protein [Dysidea avara]|uniref:uncharacterized protein isoform X2 n=1 Tax=Dysidea avara TaxID=196820 RepID=UPI003330D47F